MPGRVRTDPRVSRASNGDGPLIAALGLFGSPNFGNEATLAAFVANVRLRLPAARFLCIAGRHSVVEQLHGLPLAPLDPLDVGSSLWRVKPTALRVLCTDLVQRATEPRRRRIAAQLLDGPTVLAIPGTGLLDDFGQRPLDMPTHLDRWTAIAEDRGISISFLSVGASRVRNPASQRLFGHALARADYCSFRDAASQQNAGSFGVGISADIVPDLAFSLPAYSLPTRRPRTNAGVIGVGVMGYFGWNEPRRAGASIYEHYLQRTCALVGGLLSSGYAVHLLTGDARADACAVIDVMARLSTCGAAATRLEAPRIASFHDVLKHLAGVDVLVATRYHNVLMALLMERPAISIGYADKNDALMNEFGRRDYSHQIGSYDVSTVIDQVKELASAPESSQEAIRSAVSAARARLDAQYDRFCRTVGSV